MSFNSEIVLNLLIYSDYRAILNLLFKYPPNNYNNLIQSLKEILTSHARITKVYNMQVFEFDTVIIGSGLAGLTSALYASQFGKVAIITKSGLDISNSYNAQGGIAAAIGDEDTVKSHMDDSMIAGRGLCDKDAMQILVNEGKKCVNDLIRMEMPFDKIDGKIILGLEGGHSKRRILHAEGDATGKVLTRFMLERILQKENISVYINTTVVDLVCPVSKSGPLTTRRIDDPSGAAATLCSI
jgi:aspartate oxidase